MTYSTENNDDHSYDPPSSGLGRITTQLLGIVWLALGIGFVLLLISYSPFDANWFAATGNPPENFLGSIGASVAGVLILSIGWAAWVVPVLFIAWGIRFLFLRGNETAFARLIAVPFLLFFAAAFAASHTPPELWPHDFGLGGLAGDATLGLLLSYVPADLRTSLIFLTLALGSICGLLFLTATGVTFREIGWFIKMSFWSLGAIWFLLARPFRGKRSTTSGEVHQAKSASRRLTKKIERSEPTAAVAKGDDPFEARINVEDALSEAPKIDIAEESRKIAEENKTPAQSRISRKIAKAAAGFKKPQPAVTAKKAFNKPIISKPEPVLEEETEIAAEPTELEDLESRLKQRISQALEDRISTEPELESEIYEDDYSEDEIEVTTFDAEPVEEPEQPQRKGIFGGRAENLFSGLGGARATPEEKALIQSEPPVRSEPRVVPVAKPSIVEHPKPKKDTPSKKAIKEAQPELFADASGDFELPALGLLTAPVKVDRASLSNDALAENARMLETVLDDYGVKGDIVSVRPGPVVTMYELEPAPGLKASRVIGLADDIARSMSALSARVSTVPGRTVIGIELPNEQRETVFLREILSGRDYGDGKHGLPLALGKDIGGKSIVTDLAKMPHLLIAGTTGSGKSVAINTMILSLLYKLTPEDCRLIMIDPKMLELSVYEGIPHLLSPVVTDPKKAVVALKWVVGEMEERYRKMSKMGVRNIAGYNGRVQEALSKGEDFERTVQTGFDDATGDPVFETESFKPEKLPYIVVVVDEMADLMMVAGKEIEACIQRLAQMARASGIHLIMATQRPSVDVITGTIKANFPTRISFQVTSKVDSRTILGEMGAEQLLGMGDMLYMAGGGKITRVHGPFASDEEVEEVVQHLRSYGPPTYVNSVLDGPESEKESQINEVLGLGGNTGKEDALYDEAVAIVARDRKASTSYIQRRLSIGYNKAARLVEQMEENGVVSPANHVGKREILIPEQN